MSSEIEYERPYQRNEAESLQSVIIIFVRYNFESMYPEKRITSNLDKHAKKFVPYKAECEYHLDFRSKDKDTPLGVATINHPTQVKNHNKIKKKQKNMDTISTKSIN